MDRYVCWEKRRRKVYLYLFSELESIRILLRFDYIVYRKVKVLNGVIVCECIFWSWWMKNI